MQVDSRKILIKDFDSHGIIKDGSVRYVLYKKQDNVKPLLELKPSWDTTYNLQVNLPLKREIDTIVIVTRTSVNCYRIIISSSNETELVNCKTYDEINQVISKSLNK